MHRSAGDNEEIIADKSKAEGISLPSFIVFQ